MKRLTCNQMMLLLALYRGSLLSEVAAGTREHDFDILREYGYTDALQCLTREGDQRVVRALAGFGEQ